MTKQVVNLGVAPTGQGGDTPRSANVKIAANFDELYAAFGASGSPQALPAALPVAKGGTGGTTAAAAKTALGIGDVGVAQAWQNMVSQRSLGTLYTNTSGRPIQLSAQAGPASSLNTALNITIGGAVVYAGYAAAAGVYIATATVIVPPGATYSVGASNGSVNALTAWSELR